MAINSVGIGSSVLNLSVLNLKNQMTALQSELTSGLKSTSYAGMGSNEGFAIAARAQLSNNSAFTDTMSNINTNIGIANTALQSMVDIGNTVLNSANSSMQTLNSAGQTISQQTATSQLASMLGILNTQAGNRYLFSGAAINTPSVNSIDNILNGTTTQAGLKQVISERAQADGTTGLGRLVLSAPSPTAVQVTEDAAGSPFGLKLGAVSSTLTGATVTGPTGSPAEISVDLGATNPNNGDQVNFAFNLPDGTTETIQLTASSATPQPAGSFAIDPLSSANTAANLKVALNTAIGKLANTSLVAASAVQAGNDFFNTAGTATGSVVSNQAAPPAPITGATLLSGVAPSNSLSSSFAANDTITVNGTPITFVTSGATGNNQVNVTDSVQTLLTKIDAITGTSTPSTIHGGVITLHTDSANSLTVASSNTTAFAALGFGATATQPPLGLAGSAVNNKAATLAPITGATLLAGAAGTDSLATNFAAGNTITVNGTIISFNSGAGTTGSAAAGTLSIDVTAAGSTVGSLLTAIDQITGTTIPSTVSGGAIALRDNKGASLTVSSTNAAAFSALGFVTPATVSLPPLRVAGSVVNNKAAGPAPITGATLLSGSASTDSLATNFAVGNTINVNGTPITFVAAGAVGNQLNVTDSVQTLLTKIDSITGTTVPSTISGGAITLRSNIGASLTVTSSNSAAFAALGFGASAPATVPPLRVSGSPLSSATSLVAGTPANTISWYTGESGPGSARATAMARVDQSVTVQFGIRANETAIRSQLQSLAVFAAVTTSATNPNAGLQVQALSQRVAQNLAPQPGKQTVEDIQSDLAVAQMTMKNAQARQTQSAGTLQGIIDQAESASPDQVASEILALQTSLQASYQTTSMLSQLNLTKYLPIG